MAAGAQLSVTDLRGAGRNPTDYAVTAEGFRRGDVNLHICNISAQGFMVDGVDPLQRGERMVVALPHIGRIEAYVMWIREERAGFQFERILRLEDFQMMLTAMQPNPRLRKNR